MVFGANRETDINHLKSSVTRNICGDALMRKAMPGAVSERACDVTVNKSWTHECWSCCHATAWGCYVPGHGPESGCHCDTYEGACLLDFPDARGHIGRAELGEAGGRRT